MTIIAMNKCRELRAFRERAVLELYSLEPNRNPGYPDLAGSFEVCVGAAVQSSVSSAVDCLRLIWPQILLAHNLEKMLLKIPQPQPVNPAEVAEIRWRVCRVKSFLHDYYSIKSVITICSVFKVRSLNHTAYSSHRSSFLL